jgi:hypothetical protein
MPGVIRLYSLTLQEKASSQGGKVDRKILLYKKEQRKFRDF